MRARLVGAAAAFALALVVDALLAGAPSEFVDAPASLRGTSITLVILVASPVLVNPNTGFVGIWQKEVFGGLLLVVAMGGMHMGSQWTRFFDALLVAALATGAIGLFSSSGIDVTSKKLVAAPDMTALVRKSAIAIASAFLLYAGLRILRLALVSPHRAAHLRLAVVGHANTTTTTAPTTVRGYGVESDSASLLVAFGGAAIGGHRPLCPRARVWRIRREPADAAERGRCVRSRRRDLLTVGTGRDDNRLLSASLATAARGGRTRRAALQTPSVGVALLLTVGLTTLNRGVRNVLNVAFFLAALAVVLRVDGVGVAAYGDGVAVVAVLAAWAASATTRVSGAAGYTTMAVELVVSSANYGAGVIFARVQCPRHAGGRRVGGRALGLCGRLCRSQVLPVSRPSSRALACDRARLLFRQLWTRVVVRRRRHDV